MNKKHLDAAFYNVRYPPEETEAEQAPIEIWFENIEGQMTEEEEAEWKIRLEIAEERCRRRYPELYDNLTDEVPEAYKNRVSETEETES